MDRPEGTLLATGRRSNVYRLQRSHTLGLAGARQRPEFNCLQRAVTVHYHQFLLYSVITEAHTAPFLYRKINA